MAFGAGIFIRPCIEFGIVGVKETSLRSITITARFERRSSSFEIEVLRDVQ
jgi:hypothetical protein